MGLERRGSSGVYYYNKVREGKKVRSEYVACGELAVLSAEFREGVRAELAEELAVEREALVRKWSRPELHGYYHEVTSWLTGAMAAQGYRRHNRGEWRRMSDQQLAQAKPAPASLLALNSRYAAIKAFNLELESEGGKQILREIQQRVNDLLREGDTAIEKVLAERIAIAEVHVEYLQNGAFSSETWRQREFVERELNSASNRLIQAVRALASIRRLPPLTLVQVNAQREVGP